jgi:uncharacterized protein (TIGR01777 family)
VSPAGTAVVTGATGLVGRRLVRRLLATGWAVRAVTRTPANARLPAGVEAVDWDGVRVAPQRLAGASAVVHLAGEPVFGGLPTPGRRDRIFASRVDSTRALVAALGEVPAAERPGVFVCASAVGYYGSRGEEPLPESAPPGSGFLSDVCVAWEDEARAAEVHDVRVVSLRIGIVLAAEGGALQPMSRAFRFGLGGRLGDGRQWVPWIHVDDLVAMIRAALDDPRWTGPVNAVAPTPVRNAELTETLARVVRRPALVPVPAFAVRALLGELAGELLGSRRVVPARAAELGFRFAAPTLREALEAELR